MDDKELIETVARMQEWRKTVEAEIEEGKKYREERRKREIITDWLRTKCIWVWTILMGWGVTAGVYIAEHYDKVSSAVVAAINALRGNQ